MQKKDTKNNILDAAAEVVREKGILNFTLEAAAEKAGISKGGLLYHFPAKDALIEGMVQRLMEVYTENIQKLTDEDTKSNGKWTRAIINETFRQSTPDNSTDAGLMAAAALNPDLLKPVQDAYRNWQHLIEEDGIDQVHATILRLAADGLWFSEIFGLAPLPDKQRKIVLERLLKYTENDGS